MFRIFVYNFVFLFLLLLFLPFILFKLITSSRWRKGLLERLGFVEKGKERCILIYSPSVGEGLSGLRIYRKLKEKFPKNLSFSFALMNPEGVETMRSLLKGENVSVHLFPLDFYLCVSLWLERLKVSAVIIVEGELWPCFLYLCFRKNIPLILVSAKAKRRRNIKLLLSIFLEKSSRIIECVCLSWEKHRDFYEYLLGKNAPIFYGGTLKLREIEISENERMVLEHLKKKSSGNFTIVWGSLHAKEIYILKEGIRFEKFFHIIAPRYLKDLNLVEKCLSGKRFLRLGQLLEGENPEGVRWIIIDRMGILPSIYSIADLVVMGGSFIKKGCHNIYEPLQFGIPVITGPSCENYEEEVKAFEKRGFLIRLETTSLTELNRAIEHFSLRFPKKIEEIREFLIEIDGLERTATIVEEKLKKFIEEK